MNLELKEIKESDEQVDQFLKDNSAFFTQADFYGNWHIDMGRTVHRFVIKDIEGHPEGSIMAYFQTIEVPASFGKKYLYSPYGPVISKENEKEILPFLEKELKKILKELNAGFWRLDFEPIAGESYTKYFKEASRFTYKGVLFQARNEWELGLEDELDQILNNFNSKHRYSIRAAEKNNAEVEIVSENISEYFDKFHELLVETSKRNNFGIHREEYYRNVFKSIDENRNGYLAISRLDDSITGIMLFLTYNNTVTYLFAASGNENRKIPTTHLSHWKSIQHAKSLGFKKYNFGGVSTEENPDKSLESLTRFKTRFGGNVLVHSILFDVVGSRFMYHMFVLKKFIDSFRK